MAQRSPETLYRLDYEAPQFKVESIELTFELDPKESIVKSRFRLTREPWSEASDFLLHGSQSLTLLSLKIDGKPLTKEEIYFEGSHIRLKNLGEENLIEIENSISPIQNSELAGLFITDGFFCSDCEPQGFRHITYFADRPDVMTTYRVKLIADQKYPVLLSNGNLLEEGLLEDNRHYALWEDPFPKPTYLFAIVAGDLEFIEDQHLRPDGSPVRLRIYAQKPYIDQCHFALQSLKKAMKWDEERFNLVCDLDFYNIVAVNDFNGGAMENKGLNIFNTHYVLADPKTATDEDFKLVEAVIGHEYFHNWTGNRITCQDWFNLSLKEGLTVFREQEFCADIHHPGIRRIEDVKLLRTHQFAEDAGPLAHPVRPDEVGAVENLYTTTIYEKGAEIVRLYQTIFGKEGFNRGLAHYIEHFDGMAVTTDDFKASMEAANNRTLFNFERWYSQAGTPILNVNTEHRSDNTYRLALRQFLTESPGQLHKEPQVIPVNYALFSQSGELLLEESFTLTEPAQCLLFHNIPEKPVISLLRNFSAPVILQYPYTLDELKLLIAHETDDFAKWEALQILIEKVLFAHDTTENRAKILGDALEPLFAKVEESPEFSALLFTLPDDAYLLGKMEAPDAVRLHNLKESMTEALAIRFEANWRKIYQEFTQDTPAHRALKNRALHYLSYLEGADALTQAHFEKAEASENMTDLSAALTAAVMRNLSNKEVLLARFYERFKEYPTVIDRWFSVQARAPYIHMSDLELLAKHPAFSYKNPNRARALLGTIGRNNFALANQGPALFAWIGKEILKIDTLNPQTSSRLIGPFTRLNLFEESLQKEVKVLLKELLETPNISPNLTDQLKRII